MTAIMTYENKLKPVEKKHVKGNMTEDQFWSIRFGMKDKSFTVREYVDNKLKTWVLVNISKQ